MSTLQRNLKRTGCAEQRQCSKELGVGYCSRAKSPSFWLPQIATVVEIEDFGGISRLAKDWIWGVK